MTKYQFKNIEFKKKRPSITSLHENTYSYFVFTPNSCQVFPFQNIRPHQINKATIQNDMTKYLVLQFQYLKIPIFKAVNPSQ